MPIGAFSPNEAIDSVSTSEMEAAVPSDTEGALEALTSGDPAEAVPDGDQVAEENAEGPESTEETLETESAEDGEVEQEAAEGDEESQVKPKPKGANARIRQLVEERRLLEERMEQREAAYARQFQTMQQQFEQQSRAQVEALQYQNQMLEEQMRTARERIEREEYEKLPLAKQVELDATRRSRGEFEKLLQAEVGPLREALQKSEQARQQAEQVAQRRERIANLRSQAEEARSTLFKGVPEKDLGDAAEVINDMFLGYAGGRGVYPKDAAPVFRKALESFARSYYKNLTAQNKQQVQKSKSVPSVGAQQAKPGVAARSVKVAQAPLPDHVRKDMDSIFDYYAGKAFGQ